MYLYTAHKLTQILPHQIIWPLQGTYNGYENEDFMADAMCYEY